MPRELRTGRTTGTCATAAAMAGVIHLLTGDCPAEMDTPLPPGGSLPVPIDRYEPGENSVRVTVIKDGGDDPDATHGHDIHAVVSLRRKDTGPLDVTLDGGRGVGRVTLPGLPVAVGQPAINPVPRQQIKDGVRQAAGDLSGTVSIIIEVPQGEVIARKTLNGRLGILGGISILGTQGIVKPYSHASWKATIENGLDVARAQHLDHAVFTTGRRSERLFQEAHPDMPELSMIQVADFFAFAMDAAAAKGFSRVTWSLFFGKLVKQAQGLKYTHARTHPVDFDILADWCAEAGCAMLPQQQIRDANTARQVLEMLEGDPARGHLLNALVTRATRHAERFSGGKCVVEYAVFDFDGHRLY